MEFKYLFFGACVNQELKPYVVRHHFRFWQIKHLKTNYQPTLKWKSKNTEFPPGILKRSNEIQYNFMTGEGYLTPS